METLKRYRLWAIVVSCCMIVLGAAMILRPDISALAVCYLTGALCIAMGVCEIARYFSIGVIGILFRFDLIVGILSTLAGVLLLAHPTGALTVLPIILGFYIIIDSVFSIQAAVELRRFGLGVGKPAAMMLIKKNATVTVCHTKTVDMPSVVKEADIVIVAAGRAGVVDASYVAPGQTIIDVGINVNAEGKLCGDVAFDEVEPIVDAITPVPGGVGSVTTSVLVGHVVEAAARTLA